MRLGITNPGTAQTLFLQSLPRWCDLTTFPGISPHVASLAGPANATRMSECGLDLDEWRCLYTLTLPSLSCPPPHCFGTCHTPSVAGVISVSCSLLLSDLRLGVMSFQYQYHHRTSFIRHSVCPKNEFLTMAVKEDAMVWILNVPKGAWAKGLIPGVMLLEGTFRRWGLGLVGSP